MHLKESANSKAMRQSTASTNENISSNTKDHIETGVTPEEYKCQQYAYRTTDYHMEFYVYPLSTTASEHDGYE